MKIDSRSKRKGDEEEDGDDGEDEDTLPEDFDFDEYVS
jgi:hypothetical protein